MGNAIHNVELAPALPACLVGGQKYIYFQIPLKYLLRECVLENLNWTVKKMFSRLNILPVSLGIIEVEWTVNIWLVEVM